jgi:hypothetical protein
MTSFYVNSSDDLLKYLVAATSKAATNNVSLIVFALRTCASCATYGAYTCSPSTVCAAASGSS